MAYTLSLLLELRIVHSIFHIAQLQKYVPDPSHDTVLESIEVVENLVYKEHPV